MKKLIAILLTMAMVLALAACGGNDTPSSSGGDSNSNTNSTPNNSSTDNNTNSSTEKQHLRLAVLVGSSEDKADDSPYLAWVKRSYENWELKDQVELEIEEGYGSSGDFLTKMQLEISAANTTPDIFFEDSFQLTADQAAGYLADISQYLEQWDAWNSGSLIEATKNQVTVGDGVYGMPATTDVRGLTYNKNVLIEAGILSGYEDEWQPKNWQELLDDLYTIRDNTDAIPFWACMSAGEGEGTSMHNFETWFYATGEQLMYNDDGNWNLDGQAWEDSATMLSTIINDGLTMPMAELLDAKPTNYSFEYFQNDKLGVVLHNTGYWAVRFAPGGAYEFPTGDYQEMIGIAAMPTQYGDAPGFSSMSGGLCWSVPALSSNQELAAKFLIHMMEPENYVPFIVSYGSMSVMDLTDYPEYIDRPFTTESANLVQYTHFRPHAENYSAVSTCIYQMVENLATGMSVKEALEIFRADAQFAINS